VRLGFIAIAAIVALLAGGAQAAAPDALHVDMQYYKLPNGLKVILTRDTSAPIATVSVYYGIGFRVEPRDRTGFAHLFEHLMFQGSENAPKGTLIGTVTASGGVLNGSTRFDFTNYYEVVPSNAMERMLWLDADRMARPVIDDTVLKNQQGVVGNEVKVNVLNQPYGSWPWIDMPMLANINWYNSHNFYGDLKQIEAATVPDAQAFQKKFYQPGNAVLVVAGDIDYAGAKAMIAKYFGPIPKGADIVLPDLGEPRQTAEKFGSRVDPLAPKPGFAVGYHVPPRRTPEWYAMGLLDQILVQGQDSRLYQKLIQDTGIASQLNGGINADLGTMFNYRGPMLWTFSFTHDQSVSRAAITKAIDAVIEDVRAHPVPAEELARARIKLRSALYSTIDSTGHLGLVDLLASYALFDDDPDQVNHLEEGFDKVTPELLQKTAQDYLRTTNRSIFLIEAGAKGGAQ
jgi:predicted Zn-dependent peptidase